MEKRRGINTLVPITNLVEELVETNGGDAVIHILKSKDIVNEEDVNDVLEILKKEKFLDNDIY